jgi:hypothetical protein
MGIRASLGVMARRQRNSDFSEFRHLLDRKSGKPDLQPPKRSKTEAHLWIASLCSQ